MSETSWENNSTPIEDILKANKKLLDEVGFENTAMKLFVERCRRSVDQANEHMDTDQLTSDQAFAIAVAAGVPWRLAGQFGTVPTTDPCSVVVVDGQWKVFWSENAINPLPRLPISTLLKERRR